MISTNATAVIDAAIVYGASRWLRGIHKNPSYEWEKSYKASDDKLLFLEFLHDLLLYDKIAMDSSSASRAIPNELLELFAKVNAHANTELLCRRGLAPYDKSEINAIAEATCHLISGITGDPQKRLEVLQARVPWAYKSPIHHEYEMMASIVADQSLGSELVPFALFSFRGLCYSGFANYQASTTDTPMVYVASPGRISALKQIISAPDLKRFEFARRSYRDLVGLLRIPEYGYNFSHLNSLDQSQVSQLAFAVSGKSPREALKFAIQLRASEEARLLRQRWAERIWATTKSSALGTNHPGEQNMENISAGGDVIQIYYASPADS
jgi:hypothetical protein